MKVGFIGLGIMGSRMAANLQKKGHDLPKVIEETVAKVKGVVDEAVKFAENSPDPDGPEAMEGLYATPV